MDCSKIYFCITVLFVGLIHEIDGGPVLRDNVGGSLMQEADHHKDIIANYAPANIESKKTKRDVKKNSLKRFIPGTFEDFQLEADVPFSSVIVKGKTDEDTDTVHESMKTFSESENTDIYVPTTETGMEIVTERESLLQKQPQKLSKDYDTNKALKLPLAIRIDETMKHVTSTENAMEENLENVNIPGSNSKETVDEPGNAINIPYLSNVGNLENKNREAMLDSSKSFYRSKKESSLHDMEDIDEAEMDKNLFVDIRSGRNAEPGDRSARAAPTEAPSTPPVKYEGTLAADENNAAAGTDCITNHEIHELIAGAQTEAEKKDWVRSNSAKICDYNKFQHCIERKHVETTTDSAPVAVGAEAVVLSKTFCGCMSSDLMLIDTMCYIPAGVTSRSNCPLTLPYPAGSYSYDPGVPELKPLCTPQSECVSRPHFTGNRCLCLPNTKYNKTKTATKCGTTSIFLPIYQLFLVLSGLATIFTFSL